MTTHVFLGPTLSWDDALQILPSAIRQPPARAGDVYLAVKAGASVIAVVDGYFEQVPSVWHKEVLYALSRGVRVFGASSIGALRAAELHPFGMVGVGRVFEGYRDGIYEDDDEVAVVHASEETGFATLSEAMVNVRHALALVVDRGLIDAETHDVLVREMKRLDYPQRSWLVVPSIAEREQLPGEQIDALLGFVQSARPNVKRDDAIELLTALSAPDLLGLPPFEPSFQFESTVFWDQLVAGVRTAPGPSASVPIDAVRSHVGVVEDDAEAIFHGALLLYLVIKEAQRAGIETDSEKVARVTDRFRQSHGLVTEAATEEWAHRNGLGEREFAALMEVLALVEHVAKHHAVALDAFLPAELQRLGRFDAVRAAIAEKRAALEEYGLTFPSAEDLGTTTDDLLTWYETRFRPLHNLEDHVEARRLTDSARFVREVLSEYLVDTRRATMLAEPGG
jgi:hypothetical protein